MCSRCSRRHCLVRSTQHALHHELQPLDNRKFGRNAEKGRNSPQFVQRRPVGGVIHGRTQQQAPRSLIGYECLSRKGAGVDGGGVIPARDHPPPSAVAASTQRPQVVSPRRLAAIGSPRQALKEETQMATPNRRIGGISMGGILVIAGILIIVFWSVWLGLIVALIGLVAFGGFVRGKWY